MAAPATPRRRGPRRALSETEILDAALALLDEGGPDVFADRERHWRDRVEALAVELRQELSAHPGAVHLVVGGPMDGPTALALNERLLQLLADAGLDPKDAARVLPAHRPRARLHGPGGRRRAPARPAARGARADRRPGSREARGAGR